MSAFSPVAFAAKKKSKKVTVTSTAFKNGKDIPVKYALGPDIPGGENISIPLQWKVSKAVAKKTKSFAITMADLHPMAKDWIHMVVTDLPPTTLEAPEGVFSGHATPLTGAIGLKNSYDFKGYGGPAPPPDTGKHVYEFTVYALNVSSLGLADDSPAAGWKELAKLLKGKVVAKGKLKGKIGYPESAASAGGMMEDDMMGGSLGMTVEINSMGFSPSEIFIKEGEVVTFVNKDSDVHWPASASHPTHTVYPETGGCIGSKFDACKALAQNEEFKFTFTQKGAWNYHDHLNPGFTGKITVE